MPKTILITGANGGLGAVTVKKFLDKGYKVIAVDHSGTHLGFAAGDENFELRAVDATNEKAVATFTEEMIELHDNIDGALLLIGGFAMGDVAATDGEALRKMYSVVGRRHGRILEGDLVEGSSQFAVPGWPPGL